MAEHRTSPDDAIVAARLAGERAAVTMHRLGVSHGAYYRALGRSGLDFSSQRRGPLPDAGTIT